MPGIGLRPKGKHHKANRPDTTVAPTELNRQFLDGDEQAVDKMKELMWTTEASNPFDTHIEIPRSKPARLRRAAAAALLAVGVLNPNTANTSAAHPTGETIATAPANAHNAAPMDFDALVNGMAQYEADHPAAATHSQQPHDGQAPHP